MAAQKQSVEKDITPNSGNGAIVAAPIKETVSGTIVVPQDLEARLAAALKAKPDQFKEEAKDFWKPQTAGDTLLGVYLGYERAERYLVHQIAVAHPKTGKPFTMRVNGTRILTKELAKGEPGRAVRIIYDGESKTDSGQKLSLMRVQWLEA